MTPLFFVMAIMGCGEGDAPCTAARVLPARYETIAQCRAALPQALADNTDIDFPTITADCREQGQRIAGTNSPAKPKG